MLGAPTSFQMGNVVQRSTSGPSGRFPRQGPASVLEASASVAVAVSLLCS